jgi:hypothetical protein
MALDLGSGHSYKDLFALLTAMKDEKQHCVVFHSKLLALQLDELKLLGDDHTLFCMPSYVGIGDCTDLVVHVVDSKDWLLEVPAVLADEILDLAVCMHKLAPLSTLVVCILCDPYSGYSGLPNALLRHLDSKDEQTRKHHAVPIVVVRINNCDDLLTEVSERLELMLILSSRHDEISAKRRHPREMHKQGSRITQTVASNHQSDRVHAKVDLTSGSQTTASSPGRGIAGGENARRRLPSFLRTSKPTMQFDSLSKIAPEPGAPASASIPIPSS